MDLPLELLMALGGIGTGIVKAFKFVQEGERGIKLRFGKVVRDKRGIPKVIDPGFEVIIPFVDSLPRHHVRQQTLRLNNQQIMIGRGLIFNFSAIVIYRVDDVYKALFEISNLDQSIADLSRGILREILASKEYTELSDMEEISKELLQELRHKAEEWGVSFIQFNLTDCAPTVETAPLVNAEAGVALKVSALKHAATSMGLQLSELSPVLAAALIGVPMVTSITSTVQPIALQSVEKPTANVEVNLG